LEERTQGLPSADAEDVAWETPSQEQRNVASEKSLKNAILAIGANHRGFREAMLQFAAEGTIGTKR